MYRQLRIPAHLLSRFSERIAWLDFEDAFAPMVVWFLPDSTIVSQFVA